MKLKNKDELQKWKEHAKLKHGLPLSKLIRKLVNDDINPTVNTNAFERDIKEIKDYAISINEYLRSINPQSEELIRPKETMSFIKLQIVALISDKVKQSKIKRDIINGIEQIFESKEVLLNL